MDKNFWDYPLRKHHKVSGQIHPLITPLIDAFNLSHFCHFFVTKDGYSACLSSRPDWMEFYLYNNLFLHNPFLKNPSHIPEGIFLTQGIADPDYIESKKQAKAFGIEDSLVLTYKNENKLKAFSFSLKANKKNTSIFLNELPLLKRFCIEFERQAQSSINQLEPVDLNKLIGKIDSKQKVQYYLSNKERAEILKLFNCHPPKLSKREKNCLCLYLQGETARSIAELLQLSQRTVESYLNNIKCKLNCFSKTELIKKAQDLKDYGFLLP